MRYYPENGEYDPHYEGEFRGEFDDTPDNSDYDSPKQVKKGYIYIDIHFLTNGLSTLWKIPQEKNSLEESFFQKV